MKVKILNPCRYIIEGRLLILDANQELDLNNSAASSLIENGLAAKIETGSHLNLKITPHFENKVINLIYKKRGRPRKREV